MFASLQKHDSPQLMLSRSASIARAYNASNPTPPNGANSQAEPQTIPTLFTSTGPIAHSKPPPNASNVEFTNPKPGETPRQRVARLREAAYRARLQQIPWQDRVIVRGSRVLDNVHRYAVRFVVGAGGKSLHDLER